MVKLSFKLVCSDSSLLYLSYDTQKKILQFSYGMRAYAHNQSIQFGRFIRDLCLNKFHAIQSTLSFMIAILWQECMDIAAFIA